MCKCVDVKITIGDCRIAVAWKTKNSVSLRFFLQFMNKHLNKYNLIQ